MSNVRRKGKQGAYPHSRESLATIGKATAGPLMIQFIVSRFRSTRAQKAHNAGSKGEHPVICYVCVLCARSTNTLTNVAQTDAELVCDAQVLADALTLIITSASVRAGAHKWDASRQCS